MPRYAVIDIGTNSVKFNISERRDDGTWRTVVDRAEITRLGEGLEKTGEISRDAMERTVSAICAMAEEAHKKNVAPWPPSAPWACAPPATASSLSTLSNSAAA